MSVKATVTTLLEKASEAEHAALVPRPGRFNGEIVMVTGHEYGMPTARLVQWSGAEWVEVEKFA